MSEIDTADRDTFFHEVSRDLTVSEVNDKGRQLAQKCKEIAEAEEEHLAAARKSREAIKDLKKEMNQLVDEVTSGREEREVECYEVMPDIGNVVTIHRCDTGEKIDERPMIGDELQGNLPEHNFTDGTAEDSAEEVG